MTKSEIESLPSYYNTYLDLLADEDVNTCLINNLDEIKLIDLTELEELGNRVYAPKKWTVKDILQHIIDTERIMAYRALRFARNDKKELEGFDEDFFAENTTASKRTIEDLIDELILVRKASIALFKSFNANMLNARGKANGKDVSVLALGFIICGHQKHHLNIIKQKYLPLLSEN